MTHTHSLLIDTYPFDVGADYGSADGCVQHVLDNTLASWDAGADIVLFPEYAWLNLAQYQDGFELESFAAYFWQSVFPEIKTALEPFKDKMVVLGSAPYHENGLLFNRAIIYTDGVFSFQDKLCVTPWESQFHPGNELRIIHYKHTKIAVLICLDCEIPSISDLLKKQNIDVMLIPSATEDILGVERITRCASARAVELCCAVITCGLIGAQPQHDFIDYNIGQAGLYLPSLNEFVSGKRINETEVFSSGEHTARFEVDIAAIREGYLSKNQTNPAIVFSQKIKIIA